MLIPITIFVGCDWQKQESENLAFCMAWHSTCFDLQVECHFLDFHFATPSALDKHKKRPLILRVY
jgi:hypothetical protein